MALSYAKTIARIELALEQVESFGCGVETLESNELYIWRENGGAC